MLDQAIQRPNPTEVVSMGHRTKRGQWVGGYDVRWSDDFGKVAGFGFPELVKEGMFFRFFAKIFQVSDGATPTSMQMRPEPTIRDPSMINLLLFPYLAVDIPLHGT